MAYLGSDFFDCTRLKYVDKESKRYRGEPLLTPDGFFLKKGINAKLHLHNCLFARMIRKKSHSDIFLALFTIKSIRAFLPALARFVANHPICGRSASFWEPHPFTGAWSGQIVGVQDDPDPLHPDGWLRLRTAGQLTPKRVYISKEEFFGRHLRKEPLWDQTGPVQSVTS
ncbi:hypothetical protein CLV97_101186 [Planifilum fimeticola]|uniref:YkoP-like domain-containing protein n=1 Tax=Planifilum fimeticola TaxID=201975 RepID=A0A2T0LJP3_9BACL|nr:hypothetical protein [Planifilum fimeticola]PRX42697.1 hypothetical protein CLV97_101186 [Planifilum fimeticola]